MIYTFLALGSWLLALGSWLLALGSWLLALIERPVGRSPGGTSPAKGGWPQAVCDGIKRHAGRGRHKQLVRMSYAVFAEACCQR